MVTYQDTFTIALEVLAFITVVWIVFQSVRYHGN